MACSIGANCSTPSPPKARKADATARFSADDGRQQGDQLRSVDALGQFGGGDLAQFPTGEPHGGLVHQFVVAHHDGVGAQRAVGDAHVVRLDDLLPDGVDSLVGDLCWVRCSDSGRADSGRW